MSISVELVFERDEWVSALSEINVFDFVHTNDFHRLSQLNGEGEPVLFVARSESGVVQACWPLLRRKIPSTDLFDLTSVYGYAGPVFAKSADTEECLNMMLVRMQEMGNVSIFSRMHPVFVSQIANEEARGTQLGDVIVIPVTQTDAVSSTYRGSHRREIAAAYRAGIEVVVDNDAETLDEFVSIYQGAMTDLGASEYYYFDKPYFERLCASRDFKAIIISAKLSGRFIASSLFIVTGTIMQYYLSGSVREFKKLAPSKVILAKAHEIAIELGCEYVILGGGVGSRRDALYKFKQGFSDLVMPFYVKRVILNKETYEYLVRLTGNESTNDAFFPIYRRIA